MTGNREFNTNRRFLIVVGEQATLASADAAQLVTMSLGRSAVVVDLQTAYRHCRRLAKSHRRVAESHVCEVSGVPRSQLADFLEMGVTFSRDRAPVERGNSFSLDDCFVLGVCGALRRQGSGNKAVRNAAFLLKNREQPAVGIAD